MNPVFGLLGGNMAANIIRVLAGMLVFWKAGKQANMALGCIALVLGIIGFVPVINVLTNSWLGFNTLVNWMHIVLGLVSLAIWKWAD